MHILYQKCRKKNSFYIFTNNPSYISFKEYTVNHYKTTYSRTHSSWAFTLTPK